MYPETVFGKVVGGFCCISGVLVIVSIINQINNEIIILNLKRPFLYQLLLVVSQIFIGK